jgi:hypothetical protein
MGHSLSRGDFRSFHFISHLFSNSIVPPHAGLAQNPIRMESGGNSVIVFAFVLPKSLFMLLVRMAERFKASVFKGDQILIVLLCAEWRRFIFPAIFRRNRPRLPVQLR